MCTKPHPLAVKAYKLFLESNLGDSSLFPGNALIEREVIADLSSLLHGENCVGHIVSGGTEANLTALWAARNGAHINQPEVVLPESAHFSFTKICDLMGLKPVYAGLDNGFKVNAKLVEECISERTVAIIGTVGTSELGVVDPIEKLAKIALEYKVWLHVDAAFGGLVIPFLTDVQSSFDFALPAVKSITVDPHKMGTAVIPAGGVLFRSQAIMDLIKTETPYLTDEYQCTLTGTRPGAAAASAWATFHVLGTEGYRKIVAKCMKNTKLLADGLTHAGFSLIVEPTLNLVAFRSGDETKLLAKKLRQKGWIISYVPRYDCIRVVVMPHVRKRHVLAFLRDISV